MANDLNVVAIVGRLTRDCDFRYTSSGAAVCRFSIAVNRRKRSGDNNWEDEVSYFDCVLFGRSGDAMKQYLEKGRQVSINGELRQNTWEQDGQKRSKVEIVVNSLQLLGGGQGGGNSSSYQGGQSRNTNMDEGRQNSYQNSGYQSRQTVSAPAAPSHTPAMEDFGPEAFDDDIPF